MCFLGKLTIIQGNLFLKIQVNLSLENKGVLFMNNFCLLMDLTLKFTRLEVIMHMQRLENAQLLMEKFKEIKMEKK